jgi:hypothetical protein
MFIKPSPLSSGERLADSPLSSTILHHLPKDAAKRSVSESEGNQCLHPTLFITQIILGLFAISYCKLEPKSDPECLDKPEATGCPLYVATSSWECL